MRRIIGFIFYSIFPLLVMAERLTPYVNPFVGTDGYEMYTQELRFLLVVYRLVQILMQIFMMQLLVINILIRH